MTPNRDVPPPSTPPAVARAPRSPAVPSDEATGPETVFQAINERRARIENPELLRHLRGL